MLSIARLSKTYPNGTRALQGVDLEIGHGMFGLLGPNGAGKTTLMRAAAGLLRPDSGRILFDGVDIVQHPQAVRESLGYLPQEFGVYPKISALDLLDHLAILKGIHDRGARREQAAALLRQTNLYEVRDKAVSAFSGGMRQRFGIAQALLGAPRLLIVDEPTAGLDPEERNRFHNLLGDIGQQVTVILSTHIVEDVRDLCARVAILIDGRIALAGRPQDLIDGLEGRVWRKTAARAELPAIEARHRILSQRMIAGKPRVHVLADDCPGPGFESVAPNLEDVYFSVLRRQREARAC